MTLYSVYGVLSTTRNKSFVIFFLEIVAEELHGIILVFNNKDLIIHKCDRPVMSAACIHSMHPLANFLYAY